MSNRQKHGTDTIRRLIIWHHADRPAPERRAQLLNQLRRTRATFGAAPAADVAPPDARSGHRVLTMGVIAGASLALLLWVGRSSDETPLLGDAISAAAPAVERPAPGDSCFVATGNSGLLWDASASTPDLPPLDGRSGRWLHHWDTGTGNQQTIPNILVAGASEKARYTLEATGTHAMGWGAKLGTALRVQVEREPDKVRFQCYDASAYAGVRFRARGTGIVFLLLQTRNSIPEELGGRCRSKCWFTSSHALALISDFRDYRIEWERFSAAQTAELPQSELMLLEFLVARTPEPYAIELDAVALMTHDEADATRPRSSAAAPPDLPPARTH